MKTMQEIGPNNAVHKAPSSVNTAQVMGATYALFMRVISSVNYQFKVWCDRKKLYMELMAMDERELSHIGLTREMIGDFSRNAFRRS